MRALLFIASSVAVGLVSLTAEAAPTTFSRVGTESLVLDIRFSGWPAHHARQTHTTHTSHAPSEQVVSQAP